MAKQPAVPQDLEVPKIKDCIHKREAKQGPRVGDWVIMPDGSWRQLTSKGVTEYSCGADYYRSLPPDVRDPRNPKRIRHPGFATDFIFEGKGGSFYLCNDGTVEHGGGNDFHNVSRRTRLLDTGQTKPGEFWTFKEHLADPIYFELPCRIYRVVESDQ